MTNDISSGCVWLIRSVVIFHKSLQVFFFQIEDTFRIPQLIICGLINSKPLFMNYKNGKVLQRVSIITPSYTQLILEVWSASTTMEPKFAHDFSGFQFILAKNCRYHGMTTLDGQTEKVCYVFRLSQKFPNSRYIFLSEESENFWSNPIIPDSLTDPEK